MIEVKEFTNGKEASEKLSELRDKMNKDGVVILLTPIEKRTNVENKQLDDISLSNVAPETNVDEVVSDVAPLVEEVAPTVEAPVKVINLNQ